MKESNLNFTKRKLQFKNVYQTEKYIAF